MRQRPAGAEGRPRSRVAAAHCRHRRASAAAMANTARTELAINRHAATYGGSERSGINGAAAPWAHSASQGTVR